jgi:hypothetical protein
VAVRGGKKLCAAVLSAARESSRRSRGAPFLDGRMEAGAFMKAVMVKEEKALGRIREPEVPQFLGFRRCAPKPTTRRTQ